MSSLGAPSTDRLALGVVYHLEHNTPECLAGAFELPAAVGVAFAADEPHGLAVPVLHKVEGYAAGQGEGESWEGKEPVTEIGGYFILLGQVRRVNCKLFGTRRASGPNVTAFRLSAPLKKFLRCFGLLNGGTSTVADCRDETWSCRGLTSQSSSPSAASERFGLL